jgi:hypothetical protein
MSSLNLCSDSKARDLSTALLGRRRAFLLGGELSRRGAPGSREQILEDAGEHELKGVPDRWRLYRLVERTGLEPCHHRLGPSKGHAA